jgi:hypothetical protein
MKFPPDAVPGDTAVEDKAVEADVKDANRQLDNHSNNGTQMNTMPPSIFLDIYTLEHFL